MIEQIQDRYGFTNSDVIRAALRVLQERGEVQAVDPIYGVSRQVNMTAPHQPTVKRRTTRA